MITYDIDEAERRINLVAAWVEKMPLGRFGIDAINQTRSWLDRERHRWLAIDQDASRVLVALDKLKHALDAHLAS